MVEFLSYEGVFTAVNGPAAGLTSVDLGVSEVASTPVGLSLQKIGSGSAKAKGAKAIALICDHTRQGNSLIRSAIQPIVKDD